MLLGGTLRELDEGRRYAERLAVLPDALERELETIDQLSEQLMAAPSPRDAVLLARELLAHARNARRLAAIAAHSNGSPT